MCVIGLGLLGGSWSLGLRAVVPPLRVVGVEAHPAHAAEALRLGLADIICPLEAAVAEADLVVLATPVDVIARLLPDVLDRLRPEAIVVDLGSTKGPICAAVAPHPRRGRFVALHPIAGTEYSGPSAAFAGLLPGKIMIVCERARSDADALARVEDWCRQLGMRLSYMEAAEHDRHLAFVSHLSHISSFALGATVLDEEQNEQRIFEMAGSGFSSTVRLAKSSPDMWGPIFDQNRVHVTEALASYIRHLQAFEAALRAQDTAACRALMQRANDIRRIVDRIGP